MPFKVDIETLAYGVASSAIFALLVKAGFWKWTVTHVRRYRGYRKYRRELRDTVSAATVVGRRAGFTITDVYVEMDLAPSNLLASAQEPQQGRPPVMVLLGGPGAGKSTFVKYEVLKRLETRFTPFFMRLRDYAGDESVEAYFAGRLRQAGVPDPELEVELAIRAHPTLIVLDGLDEVRAANRTAVCDRLNAFYKKYLANTVTRSELIVTCRKEAYRNVPLDIPAIWEVRPLTDEQIKRFADRWALGYPQGKSASAFYADLFATPKVLQLARSPLLLVGGLMQYTESNLGIPEERFQYLDRIARWLTSDWAAAQGLPPDPMRHFYDRVLPRLANEMHVRSSAEIPIEDAVRHLGEWLPHYGAERDNAGLVLDGICTRTGILVRDVPGAIVFAQFSLQEYFAATIIARPEDLLKLVKDGVPEWWREAVLLAVAQLDEPSKVLDALFAVDPTLAAEAVAECPTPALTAQDRAVEACTAAIDNGHEASHRATVALLRKVASGPERRLLELLEQRLVRADGVASTVGLILAHAGTTRATELIASHPDVWKSCLSAAGYLSSSFEQVLIGVISSGNDANFKRAAELLVPRLSADRRHQLLSILPMLPPQRANTLAVLLLRAVDGRPLGGESIEIGEIATCAVHIRDLAMLPERSGDGHIWYKPGIGEIATAVACENEIRVPSKLAVVVERGLRWPTERRGIGAILASCLAALSVVTHEYWAALAIVAAVLAMVAGFLPFGHRISFVPSVFAHRREWSLPAVLTGATVVTMFVGMQPIAELRGDLFARVVAAIVFALPACAIAIDYLKTERRVDRFGQWRFIIAVFVWMSVCLALAGFVRYQSAASFPALQLLTFTVLIVIWIVFSTGGHARVFERAADVVERNYRDTAHPVLPS